MSHLLDAANLSFAYPLKLPVLRNVSLNLAPGEIVTLIGPNGSGKTTLIKSLLGHLRAIGEVAWDGQPIKRWKKRDLARLVAYLPQSPAWEPHQTVLDVLRMGRAPYWQAFGIESSNDMRVVADIAALLDLTNLLPRRLDEISGGQRQRIFLARCLVQQPRAMLLDEPNTFLDLRHQAELLGLLKRLSREKSIAVLLASHDLNLAGAFADRMMLLHEGAVVASGTPTDVLRADLLARVYGIPMQRIDRQDKPPIVIPDL